MKKDKLNKEFIKMYGKSGFQIGRIFPNKRFVGIRLWFKNFGFEKGIRIF